MTFYSVGSTFNQQKSTIQSNAHTWNMIDPNKITTGHQRGEGFVRSHFPSNLSMQEWIRRSQLLVDIIGVGDVSNINNGQDVVRLLSEAGRHMRLGDIMDLWKSENRLQLNSAKNTTNHNQPRNVDYTQSNRTTHNEAPLNNYSQKRRRIYRNIVYVYGVPEETTYNEFASFAARGGSPVHVELGTDEANEGIIEYSSREAVESALMELNAARLNGPRVWVSDTRRRRGQDNEVKRRDRSRSRERGSKDKKSRHRRRNRGGRDKKRRSKGGDRGKGNRHIAAGSVAGVGRDIATGSVAGRGRDIATGTVAGRGKEHVKVDQNVFNNRDGRSEKYIDEKQEEINVKSIREIGKDSGILQGCNRRSQQKPKKGEGNDSCTSATNRGIYSDLEFIKKELGLVNNINECSTNESGKHSLTVSDPQTKRHASLNTIINLCHDLFNGSYL